MKRSPPHFRTFTAVFTLLVLLLLSGCASAVPGLFPVEVGQPSESVYVVNHGWHTGIVIPTDRLPVSAKPEWDAVDRSKYLEIGWGEDGFYRANKVTSGIALRALFWRNPTVLHVVAVDEELKTAFPYSGIVRITVSPEGFHRLCDYLAAAYAVDDNGKQIDLGKGIYGTSRFYRATGHYYFPNTCNKWTARALRTTGAPITPFYAIRAQNVFRQAGHCGRVIQKIP